jgi:hypothetical protein
MAPDRWPLSIRETAGKIGQTQAGAKCGGDLHTNLNAAIILFQIEGGHLTFEHIEFQARIYRACWYSAHGVMDSSDNRMEAI